MAFDILTYIMAKGAGGGTTDYDKLTHKPIKYYTLVVDETNRFVDADGTELEVASVYLDMVQFVTEDKSNLAVINVTFADEKEETGHTSVVGKLMYTGIDTDEDGLQFYARLGNVEATVLVTEDEATFKQRDVDFIVRGILTMTSETMVTISNLTTDYDNIKEAIESGSNVKLVVVVSGTGTIIEFNNVTINSSGNYIQFDTISAMKYYQIVIYVNGNNDVDIKNI